LDESWAYAGAEAILAADAARQREAASLMFTIRTSFLGKAFGLWPSPAKINIEARLGKYLAVSYVGYANGLNGILGAVSWWTTGPNRLRLR
jgi:hypothetical protein